MQTLSFGVAVYYAHEMSLNKHYGIYRVVEFYVRKDQKGI